jgi:hypothetical protein
MLKKLAGYGKFLEIMAEPIRRDRETHLAGRNRRHSMSQNSVVVFGHPVDHKTADAA